MKLTKTNLLILNTFICEWFIILNAMNNFHWITIG
jgi:hypothetical protein